MKELIERWCQYCEGKLNVSYSDFYTLFHEDLTDDDIRTILQYFPAKEELFKRVKYIKGYSRFDKKLLSREEVHLLLSSSISEKISIIGSIGDKLLVMKLLNLPIVSVSNYRDLMKLDDYSLGIDVLIGDFLDTQILSKEKKYNGLFEAFYGLANSFDIQWYLGAPLLNYKVDYRDAVKLWQNDIQYIIAEDAVYYT